MKTTRFFLSESFQFLVVKFSIYLNRRVFVMVSSVKNMVNKAPSITSPLNIYVHFIVYNFYFRDLFIEPVILSTHFFHLP